MIDMPADEQEKSVEDVIDEVEIVLENEDGSMTSLGGGEEEDAVPPPVDHDANLAEFLFSTNPEDMAKLGVELMANIQNDLTARGDWERGITRAMKLLGFNIEDITDPWDGACGAFHPVLAEAVVKFQSETIMETFPAQGPVNTKIIGVESQEKIQAGNRVKADMNSFLTDRMPEYREEHERMLFGLGLMGAAFKIAYYDPVVARPVVRYVSAEDVILPYDSTALEFSQRVTRRLKYAEPFFDALVDKGFYYLPENLEEQTPAIDSTDPIKQEKDKLAGTQEVSQELHTLYETQVPYEFKNLDSTEAEGEESPEEKPYIVTFSVTHNRIVGVRRNWEQGDTTFTPKEHLIKYLYIPGFGPYGFGLLHLIGGSAETITSTLRQLIDAGTLSNLPAGFRDSNLRITNDSDAIKPGEWRDIDVGAGQTLSQSFFALPYKEPSGTLAALMKDLIADTQRLAATSDLKLSDMSAQAPVGTTLALLERMLRSLTAIQARTHASLGREFKLIKRLVSTYMSEQYEYEVPYTGSEPPTRKGDYALVDVIPVSDPNAATMSQRIILWQAVHMLAQSAPDLYDQRELHRSMLSVFGVKNIDKLLPPPNEPQPTDPVSENSALMTGKPAKAFIMQDHMAHLQVHKAMLQDPWVAQTLGQNPNAQAIQGAVMAHIMEHMAFAYRQQMERAMGVALPPPDQPLPPEIEAQLSPMLAEASQMVLQQNEQRAAAEEAKKTENDPLSVIQREELGLKKLDSERKAKDSERDFIIAAGRLMLDRQREANAAKQGAFKIGADIAKAKMKEGEGRKKLALTAATSAMTNASKQGQSKQKSSKKEE